MHVVNRFQRKLVIKFRSCHGNNIGAGYRVVGAIVGEGTIKVFKSNKIEGQEMPVYYGPDLLNSVFSIGVFNRFTELRSGSKVIFAIHGHQNID